MAEERIYLGSKDQITEILDTDAFVIVTSDGIRRMTKAQVMEKLGINQLTKELEEYISQLSEEIANGTGLTNEAKTALLNCFKYVAWTVSNGQNYYDVLETTLNATGSSGSDDTSGDDSGSDSSETEVILSSISATYSGGSVSVGTSVDELTGIVVTATYSDGSTATVTDYTLSGTIAEGSNTVTITYESMTTTITVIGYAEDEEEITLSSISVTYTGGKVIVGTALTVLTGITVTGTYSDGSTSEITGYELSGEIVEGENTITVSYGGLATTFEVTGVEGTVYTYYSDSGKLLSEMTGIVTTSIVGNTTETLTDDGYLNVVTTFVTYDDYIKYIFNESTLTNGSLLVKFKINEFSSAKEISGFRLQLSNGASGAQIFAGQSNTLGRCAFCVYEDTTMKQIATASIDTWYTVKIVLKDNTAFYYINDELVYETTTLSTNYCTTNAICNAAPDSGRCSDVEIEYIVFNKVE